MIHTRTCTTFSGNTVCIRFILCCFICCLSPHHCTCCCSDQAAVLLQVAIQACQALEGGGLVLSEWSDSVWGCPREPALAAKPIPCRRASVLTGRETLFKEFQIKNNHAKCQSPKPPAITVLLYQLMVHLLIEAWRGEWAGDRRLIEFRIIFLYIGHSRQSRRGKLKMCIYRPRGLQSLLWHTAQHHKRKNTNQTTHHTRGFVQWKSLDGEGLFSKSILSKLCALVDCLGPLFKRVTTSSTPKWTLRPKTNLYF